MLKVFVVLGILLTELLVQSCCYKILHIPVPARSHVYSQYFIGRELVRRGHEAHILYHWSIPLPQEWLEEPRKGGKLFFHPYGNNSIPKFDAELAVNVMSMEITSNNYGPEHLLVMMKRYINDIERDLLVNSGHLMEYFESLHFDVGIADSLFFVRQQVFIPQRLNIPMISYSDIVEPWLVRMPWFPSVYSPLMGVEKKNSSFYDRTTNLLIEVISYLHVPSKDPEDNVIKAFCKDCKVKDSRDLVSESILFLIPEDPILDPVRPCPSNVILIGGLSTESLRAKQSFSLAQEYLDFIDSKNEDYINSGTVVVSFGTMVLSYPKLLAERFIKAFRSLPQYRFIWRFKNDHNLTMPKNVKFVNWLPQRELLGHKSVKLFITHSGNNGQFEALYQGVPMLAVFILADQPRNARRISERGYGEEMDLRTLDTETLINNIKKIAEDPSYKERVMKASEIFKSSPDSPAERAAFWIEHVIKFGGDHLKPAGYELHLWQYLCLDVLLFIELLFIAFIVTIIFGFCKLRYLLMSKKKDFHNSNKKQN